MTPARTPPAGGPAPARAAAGTAPAQFEDVTQRAGLRFVATNSPTAKKYMVETMGSGCGFLDYDADGYQDILLLNGEPLPGGRVRDPHPTLRLYHNNRDGSFTDVTHRAGLDRTMYAMGCAVGDYDNDGYDDLYVTCVLGPSHLYHNNRNGGFTDVTAKAGVADAGMWGTSCAWVDTDGDGYLDLFVCNYVLYRSLADDLPCYVEGGKRKYCLPAAYRSTHNVLYHNNGNGTFADISAQSGIAQAAGKALGVAVWDYDGDGRPDLFVANDSTPGFLFHNLGGNRFEEVGTLMGVAYDEQGSPHSGMGIDVNDAENDGGSALVITNYSGQKTSLYLQSGATYLDAGATSGVAAPTVNFLGFGAFFLDYDNDGYKDIFQANGHVEDDVSSRDPAVSYAERPFLYHNLGDGRFDEVGARSGAPFQRAIVGRGAAWGDYDNDGREDILVTTSGGPAYLWRNATPGAGHWIEIRLIGAKSNRDGIGALVTARAGGRTLRTMVRSGSSYLSASDLRAHLGLDSARTADLEVRWPSGAIDRVAGVATDRIWTLREGSGRLQ